MELSKVLLYIYPDLDLLTAVQLQDDGEGVFIARWDDPRAIPNQAQLDAAVLPSARQEKIKQLKDQCTQAIQAGFTSNALGANHIYDSALPQDQINLLGAVMAGIDIDFTSVSEADGIKAQRPHTATQIKAVYEQGMQHIQDNKKRFYNLKLAVEQCMSEDAVGAISW